MHELEREKERNNRETERETYTFGVSWFTASESKGVDGGSVTGKVKFREGVRNDWDR